MSESPAFLRWQANRRAMRDGDITYSAVIPEGPRTADGAWSRYGIYRFRWEDRVGPAGERWMAQLATLVVECPTAEAAEAARRLMVL